MSMTSWWRHYCWWLCVYNSLQLQRSSSADGAAALRWKRLTEHQRIDFRRAGLHVCVWRACLWCTYTPWVASRPSACLHACVRATSCTRSLAPASIWLPGTAAPRSAGQKRGDGHEGQVSVVLTNDAAAAQTLTRRDDRRAGAGASAVGDTGSWRVHASISCPASLSLCVLAATIDVRCPQLYAARLSDHGVCVQWRRRADVLVISWIYFKRFITVSMFQCIY